MSQVGILYVALDGPVPFTDINIGAPFSYDGRVWVRTGRNVGCELGGKNACTFVVDPKTGEAVSERDDPFLERSVGLSVVPVYFAKNADEVRY